SRRRRPRRGRYSATALPRRPSLSRPADALLRMVRHAGRRGGVGQGGGAGAPPRPGGGGLSRIGENRGRGGRLCGQPSVREGDGRTWKRHPWAGPAREGIYGDTGAPLSDQWMYHAVADVVLADSWLRSLPEVDERHVGLMGISWGGIVASTVAGIDNRFAIVI